MKVDYLVVGAGLTGATIARMLTDAGRDVIVLDRRRHVGGNCRDEVHACGIRYGVYGPHYFRTNSDRIWDWAQRFGEFFNFEARVMTLVRGQLALWPLCFHDADLTSVAVGDYNKKMWGTDVPQEALGRIPPYVDGRLKQDKHQGLPVNGYSAWIAEMLKGIEVGTNYQRWQHRGVHPRMLVYTGAIDEFYNHEYGRLEYRGQNRELVRSPQRISVQPVCQVNLPSLDVAPIRCIEWNHLMPKPSWDAGSLVTFETPTSDVHEYPVNTLRNQEIYKKYRARADADDKLVICGRLGEYRYLDMDQAIARAMTVAEKLLCTAS